MKSQYCEGECPGTAPWSSAKNVCMSSEAQKETHLIKQQIKHQTNYQSFFVVINDNVQEIIIEIVVFCKKIS